ncbi:glycosyltransferase family 4 protein [Pseudomonas sp.]|uniref:glycosyltransferase family 4 protein n=1 Tax=Pseudomonas sp. TaxID=306 RepID=UPI0028AD6DA4|nr:glycosyltransferase family 4 protein [Pseudomonas sp.]
MRTLFILSIQSGYGGAERSIEIALRHLPEEVRVVVFTQSEAHRERLLQPGALPANGRLIHVRASERASGRRIAALRLLLEYLRYRPDAILVNTQRSALIAAMAARFMRPLARRCHLYVRDFLWQDLDFIFARLPGAPLLLPNAVVMQRLGYLSPMHAAPLGASPWSVVPDMVEIPAGEVSYDGPILHLATLNPWKGHIDLALALHHLRQRQRALELLSCGVRDNPQLHYRLLRLIERLELGDSYRLGAYVADPSALLRECRAVVVASVSHSGGPETFGRTVIEAWAMRKPVIAYASGAPAQLIEHEVDGLLVAEGDTQALAEALLRLARSPELCRRLGEAGHAKVVARYEAGAVTRQLLGRLNLLDVEQP